ncbi:hypothetical protein ACSBR1_026538 [Camellia fascicularis]
MDMEAHVSRKLAVTGYTGCFEKMDEEVSDYGRAPESTAALLVVTVGSTAVVVVVGEEEPNKPDELERIEGAGGRVINWNGR